MKQFGLRYSMGLAMVAGAAACTSLAPLNSTILRMLRSWIPPPVAVEQAIIGYYSAFVVMSFPQALRKCHGITLSFDLAVGEMA